MTQRTCRPIQVTEDVYWKLVELKFQTRTQSTDEVLRAIMGMPANRAPVKRYSEDYITRAMTEQQPEPRRATPPLLAGTSEMMSGQVGKR
jgi:hypothetical protein